MTSHKAEMLLLVALTTLWALGESSQALCDKEGSARLCCKGRDNNCFAINGQSSRCYCDEHCETSGDCCPDKTLAFTKCHAVVDCAVSEWSRWSMCVAPCEGSSIRSRSVLTLPNVYGRACPHLREKRKCWRADCPSFKVAFILPAAFRRQPFGEFGYESILPYEAKASAKKASSYCAFYSVHGMWRSCMDVADIRVGQSVCVECQPRIMDANMKCRGQGSLGRVSMWRTQSHSERTCEGLWMLTRVQEDCTCSIPNDVNYLFL